MGFGVGCGAVKLLLPLLPGWYFFYLVVAHVMWFTPTMIWWGKKIAAERAAAEIRALLRRHG